MSRDNRVYLDGVLFGAGVSSVFWISLIIIIMVLGKG